jgi:hypothetical protein
MIEARGLQEQYHHNDHQHDGFKQRGGDDSVTR